MRTLDGEPGREDVMIDWKFIAEQLERETLAGYVPTKNGEPIGRSGVTIAGGADIGQMSAEQVAALPVSQALRDKLEPYAGLIGRAAMDLLASAPLVITDAERAELDSTIQAAALRRLRNDYNAVVLPIGLPGFDEIPDAAQTVMASVNHQYGSAKARCPKFWRCCATQDWPSVIAELRNFGDAFPTRRRKEADYLEQALAIA